MMIDITALLVALIGLLGTVITVMIVPWIQAKIGMQKWEQFQQIVVMAVHAAEQLGMTGEVKDKYEYAHARVLEALAKYGIHYDDETIKAAIEAQVLLVI